MNYLYLSLNNLGSFLHRKHIHTILRSTFATMLATVLLGSSFVGTVAADTMPTSGVPATVSADALPTVQVNGIVWDQAVVGNTVYAGGSFTQARPAGVAEGGAGSVTRNNLLAYDITTGNLISSFNHSVSGSGNKIIRAVEASPDGTKLFLGGSFSAVDGQARNNFAAIDLRTDRLLPNYSGVSGTVRAITATNERVYIGGTFSSAGGNSRSMVAAYLPDGTVDPSWKADVTGPSGAHVAALVAVEPYGNLIIGGSFNKINGSTYYSTGAVKLTTGKNVKWGSQSSKYKIRMQVPKNNLGITANALEITSLTFDGKQVYLTAFTYIQNVSHPGTFEGRAAISPSTGKLLWANNCKGDTYDAVPVNGIIYSVGHPHNCTYTGDFPDQYLQMRNVRNAVAETTSPTKSKFKGVYYTTLLNWFPLFSTGTVSGSGQAGWTIESNGSYVAIGGEFPKVNGTNQQGLVRFAVAENAPNKIGPDRFDHSPYYVAAYPANSKGESTVRVYTASDRDNTMLTYELYRKGSNVLLASKTLETWWWNSKYWTFTDTGVTPGTSLQYDVKVKDGYGNTMALQDATLINDTDSRVKYSGSGWKSVQKRSNAYPDFARGVHRTTKNGSSVSLTFTGTAITIVSERGYDLGTSSVSIDGGAPETVDMYFMHEKSTSRKYFQAEVYSRTGLSAGTHTIKITKTGGKYLIIDAFKVR